MWISNIYFCIILCIFIMDVDAKRKSRSHKHAVSRRKNGRRNNNNCWMKLNAKEHFTIMEALEEKYANVRKEYDDQLFFDNFDEEMLGHFLESQGAANSEAQKVGNLKSLIPSGLNLGGHSMMRTPDSVIFFHRIKLRNDTRFRVNFLRSNFSTMTLATALALNDLHLVGNYERVQTDEDPSVLQYTPSYGEMEILLRDVYYKMEGRYRMQKDSLYLETVLSQLYVPYDGILMLFKNTSNNEQTNLQIKNIADFLDRLKMDLDSWMKDFFNDFFLHQSPETPRKAFLQYDKERIINLNRYVDTALKFLKNRLRALDADTVKLPSIAIHAFNGVVLQLKDGALSGLQTMYRRSMATNSVEKDVRKVDALIAFSSLKARYGYEVILTTGAPPLFGSLILSADELSAIMSISMVKEPLFVDLKFDFIRQLKPELLTVEGSVGRIISTFKHMLELHITGIMKNAVIDQVKQLSTLSKCVPTLRSYGHDEVNDGTYYKGIDITESKPKNQTCRDGCRDPCGPDSPFYPCTPPTRDPNDPNRQTRTRTRFGGRTTSTPTTTTTTTTERPTTTTRPPTTTTTTPTTTTTTMPTKTYKPTTTKKGTVTKTNCPWWRDCCNCQ